MKRRLIVVLALAAVIGLPALIQGDRALADGGRSFFGAVYRCRTPPTETPC
jgi:hypothetical protein